MPSQSRPNWTREEDRLLLSYVQNKHKVHCAEIARLINLEFPFPPDGIHIRIFTGNDVHTRLYQLMRPRYRFLTSPMDMLGTESWNLDRKSHNHDLSEAESSSVKPSEVKTKTEEGLLGLQENCELEKDEEQDLPLERYGEPELYQQLFASASAGDKDLEDLDHGLESEIQKEELRALEMIWEQEKITDEYELVIKEELKDN